LTHPVRAHRLPFLLAVLLVFGASVVRADEPSSEPTRFLIEKITVEGPKAAAANIVRTESLLREGGSYSEEQLRQAIYRIHRLPFVLDARFSLRKGSRRGRSRRSAATAGRRAGR
jgi:outer membrane protein assembly factor BamA